nr:MAG TPA: hypothetical protein [Caudoviricetes sp.]
MATLPGWIGRLFNDPPLLIDTGRGFFVTYPGNDS